MGSMNETQACSRDHSRLPYRGRVVIECPRCRDAGLSPVDYTVRGRGWWCKSCGWKLLTEKSWIQHYFSSSHQQARRTLEYRESLGRELAENERRLSAVRAELAQLIPLTPSDIAHRTDQVREEVAARLREIREEQWEAQRELNATREKLRVVKADLESRQSDLAGLPPTELVEKARDEARGIREEAERNAKEIVRAARANALEDYNEDLERKKREIHEIDERIEKAEAAWKDEQLQIATRRQDKVLWNLAPAEIKEWFDFLDDLEARTNHAIAVLIVRQEKDKRIAEVMSVPVTRVRDVRAGDGVYGSPLEYVRRQMGAPPDGWSPLIDTAIDTTARPALPPPRKSSEGQAVRETALRRFEENAGVRDVARETGMSVGWASKLRKEWLAGKGSA